MSNLVSFDEIREPSNYGGALIRRAPLLGITVSTPALVIISSQFLKSDTALQELSNTGF